jgi:hypothetical protein
VAYDRVRARIVQSVKAGELTPAQGERLRLFLELEASGEAEGFYGQKQFSERRRQARRVGLRVEDAGRHEVDFDIGAVLREYDASLTWAASDLVARDRARCAGIRVCADGPL